MNLAKKLKKEHIKLIHVKLNQLKIFIQEILRIIQFPKKINLKIILNEEHQISQ